jgi:hypothetical protein
MSREAKEIAVITCGSQACLPLTFLALELCHKIFELI